MENGNLNVGETIAGFVMVLVAPVLWAIGKIATWFELLFMYGD
jgi:hypothetical protein